jgi:hypothetical protein
MRIRFLVMAALLAGPAPVLAQAPRSVPQQPQPQSKPRVVVLASADSVKSGADESAQPVGAPPKHRIARVTTCRCGDPDPGDVAGESPER